MAAVDMESASEHPHLLPAFAAKQNAATKISNFCTELSAIFRENLELLEPAEALQAALEAFPLTHLQQELADAYHAAEVAQLYACKAETALQKLREAHHIVLKKSALHRENTEAALSARDRTAEEQHERQERLHRLLEQLAERQHELDESQEVLRLNQDNRQLIEELGRKQDRLEGRIARELRKARTERRRALAEMWKVQRKLRLQDQELRRLKTRCRELGGDDRNDREAVRRKTRYQTRLSTKMQPVNDESV
ncbi:unnamed protein product, partial [Ixodes hexagonus]